jgi:hypothetical protein
MYHATIQSRFTKDSVHENEKSVLLLSRKFRSPKTEMDGFGMSSQQNLLMQYINNYDDELKLGYTLDTSDVVFLNAEGVSGFSGKNIAPGSVLHGFIDDIVKGRIKMQYWFLKILIDFRV